MQKMHMALLPESQHWHDFHHFFNSGQPAILQPIIFHILLSETIG